jgi:hypothetical protein
VHAQAVEKMIQLRGGLQSLRADLVGYMIAKMIILQNYVFCATYNLAIPVRDILKDDLENCLQRPIAEQEFVAESPFYCPRQDFNTLRSCDNCSPATLDLITNMRDFMLALEAECSTDPAVNKSAMLAWRCTLRERLLGAPPCTSAIAAAARVEKDWIYESVRLTCLILLRLADTALPLHLALAVSGDGDGYSTMPATTSPHLATSLAFALRQSPLSTSWDKMFGTLFFTSGVGTAAARGRPEFAFLSAVGMRSMFNMCYSSLSARDWSAAIEPVRRFIWFQSLCLRGQAKCSPDVVSS